MKKIDLKRVFYDVREVEGSKEWYYAKQQKTYDLYDEHNYFNSGNKVENNRLIFIHYPDGKIIEPVLAKEGQCFGEPVYHNDKLMILLVDFKNDKINIISYDDNSKKVENIAKFPLSSVKDCYNMKFELNPFMIIRQDGDSFDIIWPEKREYKLEPTESFCFIEGEKIYFEKWYDEPEYHQEIVIKNLRTGEVIERIEGSWIIMPNGENWIFT